MERPSKSTEFTPAEPYVARRNGDFLNYHVAGLHRLAKASLSRLLQQFEKKADFVIMTSYRKDKQESAESFQGFPREYRALVGMMKIGAYELAGHWQKKGGEDQIERSWFFTKGDPDLSTENFIGAGRTLATKYKQDAIIVSRQGAVTFETPEGVVWTTLTTEGAIENALLKLMQARSEFGEGKLEGVGYPELKRLKDKGLDSTFYFDNAPEAAQATPEQAKTSSVKPGIFVAVPVNNFGRWAFSLQGIDYPDW